jgi:predicted RNase H-like HicB family nuclease
MNNSEILFLVEESQEGGYLAKAVNHSIFTEADSLEELKIMIKDAVECHFEKTERPKFIHLHIVRNEVIVA